MMRSVSYSPRGRSIAFAVSLIAESNLRMLLSTFASARHTSSRLSCVALLKTEILALGANSSRSAIVSSMMPSNSGCRVGSPLPAKVMTSGRVPSLHISCNLAFSVSRTSSRLLNRGLSTRLSSFHPHSQYMQLKLHSLPFSGSRFTPSDTPNLRECTGPYIISRNRIDISY